MSELDSFPEGGFNSFSVELAEEGFSLRRFVNMTPVVDTGSMKTYAWKGVLINISKSVVSRLRNGGESEDVGRTILGVNTLTGNDPAKRVMFVSNLSEIGIHLAQEQFDNSAGYAEKISQAMGFPPKMFGAFITGLRAGLIMDVQADLVLPEMNALFWRQIETYASEVDMRESIFTIPNVVTAVNNQDIQGFYKALYAINNSRAKGALARTEMPVWQGIYGVYSDLNQFEIILLDKLLAGQKTVALADTMSKASGIKFDAHMINYYLRMLLCRQVNNVQSSIQY